MTRGTARTAAQVEEMVVRSLTSYGVSSRVLAVEVGCSAQAVLNIRRGLAHRSVRPDLPRWRSCEDCRHWAHGPGECTLDFPEPEELGVVVAATECAVFVR